MSRPKVSRRQAQKMAMLRAGEQVRLTPDVLAGPLLRGKCAPGTGQIYKFVPLYATTSNGYIGRNETTLLRRVQGHKTPNSECTGLSNAIKKHGLHQFAIMLLEADIPQSELAAAEARLVEEHDTYHHGYNGTPGGEAPPLLCPAIAAKVKATKNTPESRAKTVKALRRHWDDPVAHAKHAEALKESLKASKAARDLAVKTKLADPEYKAKMIEIRKNRQKPNNGPGFERKRARKCLPKAPRRAAPDRSVLDLLFA